MSALPPKADIGSQPRDVRFVPKADIDAPDKEHERSFVVSAPFVGLRQHKLTQQSGKTTMATYVVLATFTDQGVKNAKDSPKRAEAFRQMAETFGVNADQVASGGNDVLPSRTRSRRLLEHVDEFVLHRMNVRRHESARRKGSVPGNRALAHRLRHVGLAQNI